MTIEFSGLMEAVILSGPNEGLTFAEAMALGREIKADGTLAEGARDIRDLYPDWPSRARVTAINDAILAEQPE